MCRLMTFLTCLLLSLSAGSATYAAGAIAWCTVDPDGAGAKLLFTIPVALAGMAVPGILGLVCCAFRCDFIREPRVAKAKVARANVATPPSRQPARTARPATPAIPVEDDLDLAFAT